MNANASEVIVAESADKRRFCCLVAHALTRRKINDPGDTAFNAKLAKKKKEIELRSAEMNVYGI